MSVLCARFVIFGFAMGYVSVYGAATCIAQTTRPATAPAQSPVRKLVRFVPRVDDAPERVGVGVALAGTRKDDPEFGFTVLAPATSWLTSSESPSLFWYTNKPTTLGMTRSSNTQPTKISAGCVASI